MLDFTDDDAGEAKESPADDEDDDVDDDNDGDSPEWGMLGAIDDAMSFHHADSEMSGQYQTVEIRVDSGAAEVVATPAFAIGY